jgi:hypothetical protein
VLDQIADFGPGQDTRVHRQRHQLDPVKRVVSVKLLYFRQNLPNDIILCFLTEIYHFLANRLQFEQITNLYLIDSKTDSWIHLPALRWQKLEIIC